MNKLLKTFLVIGCSISLCAQCDLFSGEKPSIENTTHDGQKIGTIERIYQVSQGKKNKCCYYILEDGYSLYGVTRSKEKWNSGDTLLVNDPFVEDDEDEVFLDVTNLKQNKSLTLLRAGWANPQQLVIEQTNYEKIDGDKVVTVTLDDGTSWKFEYFDEAAHARYWKVGDRVVLFVHTHDKNPQSPFPIQDYLPQYNFEIINIDRAGSHFHAGEAAIPVLQ